MCLSMRMCMYIGMCVREYMCYICMFLYIFMCIYMYICTYIIHMYRYSIFPLLPSFLVMEDFELQAFFPVCLFMKSMVTLYFP